MKILHTADIHLRTYQDDRWKALCKLIDIGKKEKVNAFVISGDLFDKDISAESLKPKIRDVFSNNSFKVIIIAGNHDINSYGSSMYFGEDTVILNNSVSYFDIGSVRLHGMAFESIEGEKVLNKIRYLSKNVDTNKKNILLYHGELLDVSFSRKDFGEEGEQRYMPVKLSYFKDLNIDYVLAGHFHSKFDIQMIDGKKFFVYPGSPVSITKKEIGRRSVNIFDVGNPPCKYSVDSFYYEEIVIELDPFNEKPPIEIVKENIDKSDSQAHLVLTIKGYIDLDENIFTKEVEKIISDRCIEKHLEFQNIHKIIEDDLFKRFNNKLELNNYDDDRKKQMRKMAIQAIMKIK